MSRLFSKLRVLPHQKVAEDPKEPWAAAASPSRQFPVVLIIATLAALAAAFFLGILSSNVATIKNNIFLSMDANIQKQQNQITTLSKELAVLQLSVDKRIKATEATTKDLNNSVNSKLDQTSVNMNHIEAVLQSNIDGLNTKITEISNGKNNTGPTESNTGKP